MGQNLEKSRFTNKYPESVAIVAGCMLRCRQLLDPREDKLDLESGLVLQNDMGMSRQEVCLSLSHSLDVHITQTAA